MSSAKATNRSARPSRAKRPAPTRNLEATVREIYRTLARAWGPQHWWPAEGPFEVIVGAILTQNTSWTNVEKALANLRAVRVLNVAGIRETPLEELQQLIRSSGYFRQKAQRLKNFVAFLDARYGGSLERMFAAPTEQLRGELLTQNGIGPETADAILLYAGHHETFVVDAYTRRIFERHQLITPATKYDELRTVVERALHDEQPVPTIEAPADQEALQQVETSEASVPKVNPPPLQPGPQVHSPSAMSSAERSTRAQVFNEMHGLLVQVGKHYCLKQVARCELCPLAPLLPANFKPPSPEIKERTAKHISKPIR